MTPQEAPREEPLWDDMQADAINHYCLICKAPIGEPCPGEGTHVIRIDPRFMDYQAEPCGTCGQPCKPTDRGWEHIATGRLSCGLAAVGEPFGGDEEATYQEWDAAHPVPAVTEAADPRIDALAECLYGFGFGPLDARRNVARGYLAAADAVDPLRAVLAAETPGAVS